VLEQQLGPKGIKPIMMIHMINTHVLPYMTFNDSNLDLEWFYGPEPQQSKYHYDLLRAESIGLQSGNMPLVLAMIDKVKSREEGQIAARTKFGVMMVHEIRSREGGPVLNEHVAGFGYGQPGCEVINYWSEGAPLKADDAEVKWILLKKDEELLLVLCTWRPKPHTAELAFDARALGSNLSEATDAESGEKLAVKGGSALSVPLDGYGVRIVRLR